MVNIKLDNKLSITSDSNQYILRETKEGFKIGVLEGQVSLEV